MPSFAQGAPRRANSSSVMLIVVEVDPLLWMLRSSSSCASRMMVCERLEANPRVGLRKEELEPYSAFKESGSSVPELNLLPREEKAHFVR